MCCTAHEHRHAQRVKYAAKNNQVHMEAKLGPAAAFGLGKFLSTGDYRVMSSASKTHREQVPAPLKTVAQLSYLDIKPMLALLRENQTVYMFARLRRTVGDLPWERSIVCLKRAGVVQQVAGFKLKLDAYDKKHRVPYVDVWTTATGPPLIEAQDGFTAATARLTRVHKYDRRLEVAATNLPRTVFGMYDPVALSEVELPIMRNRWLYQRRMDAARGHSAKVLIGGTSLSGHTYIVTIQRCEYAGDNYGAVLGSPDQRDQAGCRVRLEAISSPHSLEQLNPALLPRLNDLCVGMNAYLAVTPTDIDPLDVYMEAGHAEDEDETDEDLGFLEPGQDPPPLSMFDVVFQIDANANGSDLDTRKVDFWLLNMLSALQLREPCYVARIQPEAVQVYQLEETGCDMLPSPWSAATVDLAFAKMVLAAASNKRKLPAFLRGG